MSFEMKESPDLEARACGSCTLCCKVLAITELGKPQGEWCRHCAIGSGCRIYDRRPSECRSFHCGYLKWPMAGEHWFPARSKMVIVSELGGNRVAIHVDPGRPTAWRQSPYYEEIRQWAILAAERTQQVVVLVGRRAIVVLPDREVDLGLVEDDEHIITFERRGPFGSSLEALKLKADDPRIAGMEPGKTCRPESGDFA
jgi:hypothetical protein